MSWIAIVRAAAVASIVVLAPASASAAELRKETAEAFDQYVAAAEARLERFYHGEHFLWSDTLPESQRAPLQRGEIVIEPGHGSGVTEIKNGLIHDWLAAVFAPGATLAKAINVVQDYPHHNLIYKPEVAAAQILSHQADEFNVFMRIVKSKFFVTDVLNTEHEIHFVQLDPTRVYSRSYSRRVAEVSDPGKPGEHELPVGKDRGLLWRMNGYTFFEERDGGVYVESEEISLSRDMPFGMNKLLGPILHSVPAESLRNSLDETRRAILALDARP
ncbi:MAG TPA: hypothetical protein VEV17_19250 [Bryobacteraceae bacterium]|nr:hypothetical protein [Bryobacteraceae bacterium]